MAASTDGVPARSDGVALGAIWVAAAGVVLACLLSGFRLAFGGDVELLLRANGARVLLAAGAGAALALSGALRLAAGRVRPLLELEILAASAGAAAGGFLAVERLAGLPSAPVFAAGAALGAAVFVGGVRVLDRPRRWTNPAAAAALGVFIAAAALTGTYARAREDGVTAVVAWLLGDVSSASLVGGVLVLAFAVALTFAACRVLPAEGPGGGRSQALAWLALGLGVGAAGPLAFVGTFAPRAVGALAGAASARARTAASVAAGAAGVAAIATVPRLLVGGYALPLNVGTGMLAVPVFLLWNRARLRREAGRLHPALEGGELVLVAGATAAAAGLVVFLARLIRFAT